MRFLLVLAILGTTTLSVAQASMIPIRRSRVAFFPKMKPSSRLHQSTMGVTFRGGSSSDIGSSNLGTTLKIALLSIFRGGSSIQCGPTNLSTALKTAFSTAVESTGLFCVLAGAARLSADFPIFKIAGLPALQWMSAFVVIFGSSAIKSVLDGGVSAASNQALRPDVVPDEGGWYAKLKKPWFNPPGWVFPIMWLIVSKPTQLWAVSRILKSSSVGMWAALSVYCTHLALGDGWNQVFFGCQRVGLGAGVIVTFWGMLASSAFLFRSIDTTAGMLMLPTMGWVTVASALNLEIYRLNKSEKK